MSNKKPRILLTNDDGIYSKGIYALWEAMCEIGEVTVLAPNTEKSAVGQMKSSREWRGVCVFIPRGSRLALAQKKMARANSGFLRTSKNRRFIQWH